MRNPKTVDHQRSRREQFTDSLRDFNSKTMSAELDDIFKALRVVPEFDGNPHVLTRFIRLCDSIVVKYVRPGAENEHFRAKWNFK